MSELWKLFLWKNRQLYKTIQEFYPDFGLMSQLFLKDLVLRCGKLVVNTNMWPLLNAVG